MGSLAGPVAVHDHEALATTSTSNGACFLARRTDNSFAYRLLTEFANAGTFSFAYAAESTAQDDIATALALQRHEFVVEVVHDFKRSEQHGDVGSVVCLVACGHFHKVQFLFWLNLTQSGGGFF